MDFSKVEFKDISKVNEFTNGLGKFKKLATSIDGRVQVWERRLKDSEKKVIEVIRPIYRKEFDVWTYPSSEQFGTYGLTFPMNSLNLRWAFWIMDNGFPGAENYLTAFNSWKAREASV